jgi:hypothetical protein
VVFKKFENLENISLEFPRVKKTEINIFLNFDVFKFYWKELRLTNQLLKYSIFSKSQLMRLEKALDESENKSSFNKYYAKPLKLLKSSCFLL